MRTWGAMKTIQSQKVKSGQSNNRLAVKLTLMNSFIYLPHFHSNPFKCKWWAFSCYLMLYCSKQSDRKGEEIRWRYNVIDSPTNEPQHCSSWIRAFLLTDMDENAHFSSKQTHSTNWLSLVESVQRWNQSLQTLFERKTVILWHSNAHICFRKQDGTAMHTWSSLLNSKIWTSVLSIYIKI